MNELDVRRIKVGSAADMLVVKTIWETLEKGEDMTAFQSYSWNALLVEEFLTDSYNKVHAKLYVYYIMDEEHPVMLVPLIVQKNTVKFSWWGRRKGIYFLGINSYSDYLNFIYTKFNEEAANTLLRTLENDFQGLPFYLNYIRQDTKLCAYLQRSHTDIMNQTTSIYVDVAKNSDAFISSLSKSTKQNLRTAKNRMERDNLVYKLEIYGMLSDQTLVDQLITIHTVRSKSKNRKHNTDMLHLIWRILMTHYKESKKRKYNIIMHSMKRMKNSFLVVVTLNEEIVSYLYGLVDNHAVRIMQNCFDERYKFYSPMFRGAFDFIKKECDEKMLNIGQIDFTRGDEEYKLKLGGKEMPLFHFVRRG